MIYCNYDALQYIFSKTYREKESEHNNFYHMGKHTKTAVQKFGTAIKDTQKRVKNFYHGIDKELVFPQIVGAKGCGISVYCPLSTSSSKTVAINFTNNKGQVVQIGGELSCAKYFSVKWLSDYPNEQEYLFVQNNVLTSKLAINNIFDCQFGYEYGSVLVALNTIHHIMKYEYWDLEDPLPKLSVSMQSLISKIVKNQLSSSKSKFNDYATKMNETFFYKQTDIFMDYRYMTANDLSLLKLFFVAVYDWVKLKDINLLFPNVTTFELHYVHLCPAIMKDIFKHLSDLQNKSKLECVGIWRIHKNSELSAVNAELKYKEQFKKINFSISSSMGDLTFRKIHIV
eukprot:208310_1